MCMRPRRKPQRAANNEPTTLLRPTMNPPPPSAGSLTDRSCTRRARAQIWRVEDA